MDGSLSKRTHKKQAKEILNRMNFVLEISQNMYYYKPVAGVAQLVEHLIRNEGVVGSSPITGTRLVKYIATLKRRFFITT